MLRKVYIVLFCLLYYAASSQNLTDIDTALLKTDTTKLLYTKFGNLNISGYVQAQYQLTQTEGAKNFSGGDFSEFSNSRFMLRRARFKFDYLYPSKSRVPVVYFALQVDATERGVVVRDMYGQLIDPRWNKYSVFMGLFARPFGFETNLSSASREAPERGRMNQILFPRERDLGIMLNFHDLLGRDGFRNKLNLSFGIFNGPGLQTTADQDSYKDLISRLQVTPVRIGTTWYLSGAVSGYYGGVRSNNETVVTYHKDGTVSEETSTANIARRMDRIYYGADVQLRKTHRWGSTELRLEYIKGIQPGTHGSTFTALSASADAIYSRPFDGAYIMFLQSLFSPKHQLLLKYDFYDPNKTLGRPSGETSDRYGPADLRYDTWGLGYCYYLNKHCKAVIYYDFIRNEPLAPGDQDLRDDVFTARLHFSF